MSTETPLGCDTRGMDGTLYINGGTDGTPIWIEHLGLTGDVTATETEDDNELSTRNRDRAVKEYSEGETDLNITGTQVMDAEYYGWQVMYSMRTHGTPKDLMWLSQPISEVGAVGWRGYWRNKDRTGNFPASGPQTQNFSLRPAACSTLSVRAVKIAVASTYAEFDPTVVEAVES